MTDNLPTASTIAASRERETSAFLRPDEVVQHLGIRPGMTVADLGCGAGHFTIPIARLVGESGSVFAIDIQKQAINSIASRANLEHLMQIEPVWADLETPEGSHLKADSVDCAIISNILFQTERKENIMAEAHRIIRPEGHLIILEWDETPFAVGPAMEIRIPKRFARSLAEGAGFLMEKEFEAGSDHYGLMFRKQ